MKRIHLDSSNQPKYGWRVVPFNEYYEAHPSGLIRNIKNKKLIKGTQGRKYSKYTAYEIVYFINPIKTTHTRQVVIAKTFPEKVSISSGTIDDGYICFKDGNTSNCNVDNLFVTKGKVGKQLYILNGQYSTSKDLIDSISQKVNVQVARSILNMIRQNVTKRKTKNYRINRNGDIVYVLTQDKKLYHFNIKTRGVKQK